MGRREGVEHTVRVEVDGGQPPNRFHPEITAKVQVHFPPGTCRDEVARAVLSAAVAVLGKLDTDGGWLLLAPIGVGPV